MPIVYQPSAKDALPGNALRKQAQSELTKPLMRSL
jgi:hypothetical protein